MKPIILSLSVLLICMISITASAQVVVGDGSGNQVSVDGAHVRIKSGSGAVVSGNSIVVSGHGQTQTFNCEGKNVTISGSQNTIRLKGNAKAITMAGSGNKVTVDGVYAVTATGSNNSLSYLHLINNSKPAVSIAGSANSVVKLNP